MHVYMVLVTCCAVVYRIVGLWRTELAKTNEKAAESIADPSEYENLFPELGQTLQAEKVKDDVQCDHVMSDNYLWQMLTHERKVLKPASLYPNTKVRF